MDSEVRKRVIEMVERLFVAVVLLITLIACLAGCKTVQTSEQVQYKDSTDVAVRHDTVYVVKHDTVYVEVQQSVKTDEGTMIEFAEGGGSYNAKTGEASGVQRVRSVKEKEENTRIKVEWSHTEEEYKATIDSLQTTIQTLQKENETLQQPKECNHLKIFLWGLAIGIVLVYVMRLVIWLIRKYYHV